CIRPSPLEHNCDQFTRIRPNLAAEVRISLELPIIRVSPRTKFGRVEHDSGCPNSTELGRANWLQTLTHDRLATQPHSVASEVVESLSDPSGCVGHIRADSHAHKH